MIAGALARLGAEQALVVSSADGLDELSTSGTTRVVEVDGGAICAPTRSRRRTSGSRAPPTRTSPAAPPEANAATTRRIFAGEPGPARDLAVLNAGAAIYAAGRADGLEAGVRAAEAALDGGGAAACARSRSSRSRVS